MNLEPEDPKATLTDLRRRFDAPPLPFKWPVEQVADDVLTARTTWVQSHAKRIVADSAQPTKAQLMDEVTRTANPLRELAAALTAFADRCDEDGFVPLGVTLVTDHLNHPHTPWLSWGEGRARVAHVTVSVRGVRRAWVEAAQAVDGAE